MSHSSPAHNDTAKSAAWQRLWATGAEDSFGQSAGEPPASAHWANWFAALPPAASVLDLASGSGALLRRFLASNNDPQSHCHGVDVVTGQPAWLDALDAPLRQRVSFTGGVAITELPFGSAQFDAVVSQFGVEYADLARALPEALRVLRPEGRLGLLIHHRDSRPASLARAELVHARWLLSSGWLEAASQMSQAMALTSTDAGRQELSTSAIWAGVRFRFDSLTQQVQSEAASSNCPDLLIDAQHWMTQAFRASATHGAEAGKDAVRRVVELISDSAMRLDDMLAHALSEDQINGLVSAMSDLGRQGARVSTLADRGYLLGWWVQQG